MSADTNNQEGKDNLRKLKEQMYSRATQPISRPRRVFSDGVKQPVPNDWNTPIQKDVQADTATPTAQTATDTPKMHVWSPRTHRVTSPIHAILIASIVLFALVAVGVGVYLVSGSNVVSSRNIALQVYGPRTIDGGSPVEFQVSVTNSNDVDLEFTELVVSYPPETLVIDGLARNKETKRVEQRLSLGTITSNETRSGTVYATLLGQSGDVKDVNVSLEYRLANSSGIFSAETTYAVQITSDAISMRVDTNEEAVAGQKIDVAATIMSHVTTPIGPVYLAAEYPFGFALDSAVPETYEGTDNMWSLGVLEPNTQYTVHIQGVLDGQEGDERTFRLMLGTRDDARSAFTALWATAEHALVLARPFLALDMTFDGVHAREFVALPGESIPIRISWLNNISSALSDVVIAATISGEGADQYAIDAQKGFYRSIDGVALWDKNSTSGELKNVGSAEGGTLSLRVTPKTADDMIGIQDPTITFELHASGEREGETNVPETLQAAVKKSIKVQTSVGFAGSALYFTNPLGSVGPLPPKVENETTYGILWEVSNTTNMVRDTVVTATLPPYMRWLGVSSPSVEHISFNERDGTITWNIGKLLPQTGIGDTPPRRIVFGVGLVPSTSQVGQVPDLVQNITVSGVDNFTGRDISIDGGDFTTNLTEDAFSEVYSRIIN